MNNPLRYTDPTGHYDTGGTSDVGYAQLCTNSNGFMDVCGGNFNHEILVNGSKYMKVWNHGQTRYIMSNTDAFTKFAHEAIDYANDLNNITSVTGTLAVGVLVTALATCWASGFTACFQAFVSAGVIITVTLFWNILAFWKEGLYVGAAWNNLINSRDSIKPY